jgi:hypothetical protein
LITSAGTDYHGREDNEKFFLDVRDSRLLTTVLENNYELSLHGGRLTDGVVKKGNFLLRPGGTNDAFVNNFLIYLEGKGFKYSQKYRGKDLKGRNIYEYINGFVPNEIGETTVGQLTDFIKIVKKLHNFSSEYLNRADKVICHNDLSPCNVVFVNDLPFGIIDWDLISVGERWEDLTYIFWLWFNIGDRSRIADLIIEGMEEMLNVYDADEETRQNFAEKLIKRMEMCEKALSITNPYYGRTLQWITYSKKWVLKNEIQIKKIIG